MVLLKDEKGFTLIEALASVVILGIIVISFLSFSGYSVLTNHKSNQIIEAQRIAEEQLSLARHYIRLNNTLPTTPTVAGYVITIQTIELVNTINYVTSSFQPTHFSLQAIVLMDSVPKVLTVTVSWSNT